MPNHVANVIKMEGIKNLLLFSADDDGKQYLDFNKLIPMPESLNIESGYASVIRKVCVSYQRGSRS